MVIKRDFGQSGSIVVILLIVAVFAVGGAGAYVATDGFGTKSEQSSSTDTATETQQQESNATQETSSSVSTLKAALTGGDAVKCTYDQDGSSGTAYISSQDKFRVDYTSPDGDGHLVLKDNAMYIWADGETEGFKIANPKEAGDELTKEYEQFDPEKLEENYSEENLDCEKIAFEDSLVDVPSTVTFRSFEEMFQNIPQN